MGQGGDKGGEELGLYLLSGRQGGASACACALPS